MQFLFDIGAWLVGLVAKLGYCGIVLLMALESSFFPFPSEIVIPPAGYLAAQGKMSIYLVIIAGIVGSLLGALFNYYISFRWGRATILKMGKIFGFDEKMLGLLEGYFQEHGEITTFVGRLLPGIRQYISLPAGMAKMDLLRFILYTSFGTGIWVTILAWIGYYVGNNLELVKQIVHNLYPYILAGIAVVVCVYVYIKKRIGL